MVYYLLCGFQFMYDLCFMDLNSNNWLWSLGYNSSVNNIMFYDHNWTSKPKETN